jgi:replication initiator protein RepSA
MYGSELLIDAALAAARHVSVLSPAPDEPAGRLPGLAPAQAREIRWGAQVEVRELDSNGSAKDAASCAGYIAKYATKSTEAVGGLMYRLDASDVQRLKVRPHVRRLVECAWRLGGYGHLHDLKLRRWAHSLGFRGHCFTKSRRYSTTFTALRQARHEHQLRRAGELHDRACRVGRWRYSGSGYRTLGDAWLAESGRKRALDERRVAREELRTDGVRDEGRRR